MIQNSEWSEDQPFLSLSDEKWNNHAPDEELTSMSSIKIGKVHVNLFLMNLFFAFLTILGQTMQNVVLPLFVESLTSGKRSEDQNTYFVVCFGSFCFVIIFGAMLLYMKFFTKKIGPYDANGLIVVFSSPSDRTAPFLQIILSQSTIPFTFLFTFLVLKFRPTALGAFSVLIVILGIFIAMMPTILGWSGPGTDVGHGLMNRLFWPAMFALGFVPVSLLSVLEEKFLKGDRESQHPHKLNLIYFLFFMSFYQFVVVLLLWPLTLIPKFGIVDTPKELYDIFSGDLKCFIGLDSGCQYAPLAGVLFLTGYVLTYLFGGLLVKFASANFYVISVSLSLPLGALFWTLFEADPFKFHPVWDRSSWFSLTSVPVVFFGMIFYQLYGEFHKKSEFEESSDEDDDQAVLEEHRF